MRKFILFFTLLILIAPCLIWAQGKVKTSTKTVDPYYLKYPTTPLPYYFTENYATPTIGDAVMRFYVNGEQVAQKTAKELRMNKAMTDFESSYFGVGNLVETNKGITNKTGVAELQIHIDEMKVTIETKEGRSVGAAYNMPFYNTIKLEIPMNAKIVSATTNEVFAEETITTGREDRNLNDLVSNRDEANEFLKKRYASKDEANKEARYFLEKNASNIASPVFYDLIGLQQIIGDWNRLATKYKMKIDRAGVMFITFFKDEKNSDFALYNQKADEIINSIKSIESNYNKNKKIKNSDISSLEAIANFLRERTKGETNEDVKTVLETNALVCDIVSGNFAESIILRDRLVGKEKLNTTLSNIYSELDDQSTAKTNFLKSPNGWSTTYREFYDKVRE